MQSGVLLILSDTSLGQSSHVLLIRSAFNLTDKVRNHVILLRAIIAHCFRKRVVNAETDYWTEGLLLVCWTTMSLAILIN